MNITRPVGINTVFAEATVGEDGALHLKDFLFLFLMPGQKVTLMSLDTEIFARMNGEMRDTDGSQTEHIIREGRNGV